LPAVRPFLALGGLVAAAGTGLLVWGVRQQVAWSSCGERCAPSGTLPVALGILLLVAGGFFAGWTAAAGYAGRTLHPSRHDLEERERLLRVGVAGRARVLRSREAGTSPVGDPLVDIELAVEVKGRAPYEVRQRTAVPRRRLRRLQEGSSVAVVVDPQDPARLVLKWPLIR
jgi:hypothetical protein